MLRVIAPFLAVLAAIYVGAAPVLLAWSPCTQYSGVAALSGFLMAPLFFVFGLFVLLALTTAAVIGKSTGGFLAALLCLFFVVSLIILVRQAIKSRRSVGRWPPVATSAILLMLALVSSASNAMFCASLSV